jgi:hypothetical protein
VIQAGLAPPARSTRPPSPDYTRLGAGATGRGDDDSHGAEDDAEAICRSGPYRMLRPRKASLIHSRTAAIRFLRAPGAMGVPELLRRDARRPPARSFGEMP